LHNRYASCYYFFIGFLTSLYSLCDKKTILGLEAPPHEKNSAFVFDILYRLPAIAGQRNIKLSFSVCGRF
jgi:hypothetical protein